MRRPRCLPLALLAAVLSAPFLTPPLAAEDPPPGASPETPPAETPVTEASAEELPGLLAALDTASKKKKAAEALAALKPLETRKHASLEKGYTKLLRHAEVAVALKAAELLEQRAYPEWAKGIWANAWGQAINEKRPTVRVKALRSLARLGFTLDKKQFDDVEGHWRWLVGNPNRTYAPQLVDMAFFIEQAKDKRFARWLAEMIDEPMSNAPASDGTNPPAAWWEEKWHMWNESKAAIHTALKALTGMDFTSTKQAKEWIEEHKKDGFDW
jgi:hypothetical protein